MLGIKSAYLRSAIVKHALGKTTYTKPTNVYLALYTSDPTVNDTGTEVTGGSYARQQLSFGTEADGNLANDTSETFSSLPACVITHWGIRDASTSGNLLYFGALEVPLNINATDNLSFIVGNIQISEK